MRSGLLTAEAQLIFAKLLNDSENRNFGVMPVGRAIIMGKSKTVVMLSFAFYLRVHSHFIYYRSFKEQIYVEKKQKKQLLETNNSDHRIE